MCHLRFYFAITLALLCVACKQTVETPNAVATPAIKIAESFAYPVGAKAIVTEAKDADGWYNARNFGENDHLGEDWNKNSGGNTDCGEPVYSIADGTIVLAQDEGPGWGNVVIVEHTLPSGEKIESLYGHLETMGISSGEVKKREQIGTIGNANGRYPCHLHFEIRARDCPMWGQAGGGYSQERTGWIDPSDFIDSHKSTN